MTNRCTSGSVVEYRLAKARVAGSNPVSCFYKRYRKEVSKRIPLFLYSTLCDISHFYTIHQEGAHLIRKMYTFQF